MRDRDPGAQGMHTIYQGLNTWVNITDITAAAIIAIVTGGATWLYQWLTRQDRGVFYEVLYDEVINTDLSLERSKRPDAAGAAGLWQVYSDGKEVTTGSLVVIEVRNDSKEGISENAFGDGPPPRTYRLEFPGRQVVNFKVRNSDAGVPDYHFIVNELSKPDAGERRVSFDGSNLTLPGTALAPGQSFKLFVLLDDPDERKPGERYDPPRMHSAVITPRPPRRQVRQYVLGALTVILALVVVAAGVIIGLTVESRESALAPDCFNGTLVIEGSTAFAPIADQVKEQFTQTCAAQGYSPNIVIDADGSQQGYRHVASRTSGPPTIVMYDGSLQPGASHDGFPDSFAIDSVGEIIFAVVGNTDLPARDFGAGQKPGQSASGGGLTNEELRGAFETPATPGASPGHPYVPAGRTGDSGTRQTFESLILNGTSNIEKTNGVPCTNTTPAPRGTVPPGKLKPGQFCLWDTTMDLLGYVNSTPYAISYAEADALPFFPDVRAIPIGGYGPTRANALDGNYTFVANEHLLTEGKPTADEEDFLRFLSSGPEIAQLGGNAFIACPDLSGSAIPNDCGEYPAP